MGKPEGKRPLGRNRGGEDNIKMYLQEVWWWIMERIDLNADRDRWRTLIHVVMNFRVP